MTHNGEMSTSSSDMTASDSVVVCRCLSCDPSLCCPVYVCALCVVMYVYLSVCDEIEHELCCRAIGGADTRIEVEDGTHNAHPCRQARQSGICTLLRGEQVIVHECCVDFIVTDLMERAP